MSRRKIVKGKPRGWVWVLALVLAANMAGNAFAATGLDQNGSETGVVTGTYSSGQVEAVYCVDISWDGKGTITITNHSNVGIEAIPSFVPSEEYPEEQAEFSSHRLEIGSADNGVEGAAGTPVKGKITVNSQKNAPSGSTTIRIE
jgi:hypothetical protein